MERSYISEVKVNERNKVQGFIENIRNNINVFKDRRVDLYDV